MVLGEGRGREFLFTFFLLGVADLGQWKMIPEGAHVCRSPPKNTRNSSGSEKTMESLEKGTQKG